MTPSSAPRCASTTRAASLTIPMAPYGRCGPRPPPADDASLDTEQLGRRAAQDGDALVVAEARRLQHEVDLGAGPRERIVGPDHDLAGPGLGDQVAQRLGREHDSVEEQLA